MVSVDIINRITKVINDDCHFGDTMCEAMAEETINDVISADLIIINPDTKLDCDIVNTIEKLINERNNDGISFHWTDIIKEYHKEVRIKCKQTNPNTTL